MPGLHHKVLKSAIAKYAYLVLEEKNEDQIKEEIAKDEKGFNDEAIHEIYLALTKDPEPDQKAVSGADYVVVSEFRDINDFETKWAVGDDVSHFSKDRIEYLLAIGLIKKSD